MVTRRDSSADRGDLKGSPERIEDLLVAVAALLADERERTLSANPEMLRTEILLSNVGLDHHAIGLILGKSPDAVRMLLKRAAESKKKTKGS
jgi:DNA-directed RNA polymerase specialized sigma24 family protein